MDAVFSALLVEMALLCFTGCTSTQPRMPQVALPPKRIVQLGYSVTPLNDRGWVVVRRTPTYLALAKAGKNPDETIAIEARAYDLAPLQARSDLPLFPKDSGLDVVARFSLMKAEVTPDERATCERRHVLTEDRAPARRSGSKDSMILEALMLSCVHPVDRNLVIDVAYSHRYEPAQRDPEFDAKAAALLRAVQFTDLGRTHEGGENVR